MIVVKQHCINRLEEQQKGCMKQAIHEIIDAIIEQVNHHPKGPSMESHLRNWLVDKGFNLSDVNTALLYMRQHLQKVNANHRYEPGLVRHLSAYESHKISNVAQTALARLEMYELIDPLERELLIERLLQMDCDTSIEELDILLAWLLYATRDVESQQTIYNVITQNLDGMN